MTQSTGLLLCGTGGFATEVVSEFPESFGGVFDPMSHGQTFEGLRTFADLRQVLANGFTMAVIAVGQPRVAQRIYSELSEFGIRLAPPLVSQYAVITGDDVELGSGSVIMAGTVLTNHITLGMSCVVNINCTIGHGTRAGTR